LPGETPPAPGIGAGGGNAARHTLSRKISSRCAANLMTKDEVRNIAAGIAKLPELLKKSQ
jgi:hypothetical protein